MLKRTNSLNAYIRRTSSRTLSRSRSFHSLPPNDILNININHCNPKLINGYVPSIVKKVNLQEMVMAVNKLYYSIGKDGWLDQILNLIEDSDDITYHINEIENKRGKTADDFWDLKCSITLNLLIHVQDEINDRVQNGDDKNFVYFICYIQNVPIGMMIIRCYEEVMLYRYDPDLRYYPEVTYLIMHPGLKNCAYLLMEEAVNMSYKIGCHGKLKLSIATSALSEVYRRMGFIHYTQEDMALDPNGNRAWIFSSGHDGYRFTGTC
ncbi:hypothetical protein [Xenorhabdus lircayensis]|uniref:N-acetyltransferase n=1 Tax=Xenorhabdus lircayensis TaxID=2763499 RepID=A0ABS0U2M2_9GAMM|nr:hypothetical protein [Xenorhabdus lircayensis]MBI6548114.1 hypothetical protein [Xenorhabdus lircayensis]